VQVNHLIYFPGVLPFPFSIQAFTPQKTATKLTVGLLHLDSTVMPTNKPFDVKHFIKQPA